MRFKNLFEAQQFERRAYNNLFSTGNPYDSKAHIMLYQKSVELIKKYTKKNYLLLDIGCGDGRLERSLFKYCQRILGIDISEVAIKKAMLKNKVRNVKFLVDSIESFKPKEKFDVVTMLNFIEHVYDLNTVMKKVYKLMKPGGFLIITSRNRDALTWKLSRLFGKKTAIEGGYYTPLNEYNYSQLERILKKQGFLPVSKEGFILGPIGFAGKSEFLTRLIFGAGSLFPDIANYMFVCFQKR